IWCELLGVEQVGRYDHFFEMGGHSLMAVQLISRIRSRLGLEVAIGDLFTKPCLTDFAQVIQNAAVSHLPAISQADRSESLPLSFAQQRLWFIAQLEEKASAAYHIPGGVKLIGPLDRDALKASLDRIVARHEALRTHFEAIDGTPMQVIAAKDCGLVLQEHNLSDNIDVDLEALAKDEATRPFDLAKGPLIRGQLLRLSATEHVLLVTMHHIVSDGWSMGVLINEVSTLYQAFSQGQPDPLPKLSIQYVDYAIWQQQWLKDKLLQQQLDYWTEQLSGAPALLEIPTDHSRPTVQDYAGASVPVYLDAELTRALTALSQQHGTTLFMTLLSGWAALLSRLSGEKDIVIGTPTANRTRSEIEPLIGFFVNTLALRLDLSEDPTVCDLIEQVRQTTLSAQSHQDIPFEQVVEAVDPVRSMSHSPLFQVMFAWQNTPSSPLVLKDLTLEPIGAPLATTQFDLSLSLGQVGDTIIGGLTYATGLFEQSRIERYIEYFKTLLRAMTANDKRPVGQLDLLSSAEREQVLYEWNATTVDYPGDQCIHQLFEAQVEK
ncbi:MAG: condensation domain-containing protein, partial [Maritimibacter sp.]